MKLKQLKVAHVGCSFCKKKEAYHKIQGYPYGGRTVCRSCWEGVKEKHQEELRREDHLTEADYQTWYRL